MIHVNWRKRHALGTTALTTAWTLLAAPALAASVNTTAADVNLLNLLSPFLSLNGTATGQQTLTLNLGQAEATNALAATSPVIEAASISDKTIFSGNSTAITLANGNSASYGPGANLAGGLPAQAVQSTGGIAPYQQYGGLGTLGTAYQAAVSPTGATAPALVNLLNAAYTFNSTDLGVAKYYFANGTYNGTVAAVAPSGYTLPTYNGLPNTTNSVYDLAYGVTNTGANQDIYGDSRPVQVTPSGINGYDPTALTGLATNPSFPSGHTTYAYTDSILIGMLEPQFYQSMLLRGSEYGNSRIALGVHYPLDIIGSRALSAYDLANLLNGNAGYATTNAVGSTTALSLSSLFTAAQSQTTAALGGTAAITAAAANNPYNTYSASTYVGQGSSNAAIYAYRLTYGLPTLSFTAAPREQAPAGGPDASILLATVYGGSTAAAQALAPSGGLYGSLATSTINQIIVNTETNALAAFYGTSLSYWARINLYAADGYFQGVTGTINLASTDRVTTPVTVANTGVLSGTGTIGSASAAQSLTVQSGGVVYPGVRGETSGGTLTVYGPATFNSGSTLSATGYMTASGAHSTDSLTVNGNLTIGSSTTLNLNGTYMPGVKYSVITVNGGTIAGSFTSASITTGTGLSGYETVTPQYAADPSVYFVPRANFVAATTTGNQAAVAAAIDARGNTGAYGANGTTLLTQLIGNTSAAAAPAAFASLSGEGLAGQQDAVLEAGNLFASAVMQQMTQPADGALAAGSHRAWATGFGQHDTWDSGNGASGVTGTNAGFAAGVDMQITPDLLVGFAGGYSGSDFTDSARSTTGHSDGAHFGLYGKQAFGAAYVAGTIDYARYSNTTGRTVAFGTAGEGERGQFGSNEFLGRIEGGYQYKFGTINATPFVGFQAASIDNGGFLETTPGGGTSVYGLQVYDHIVSSQKTFVGAQVDTALTFGNGMVLKPFARLDWEHEFTTDRVVTASLQSLPAAFSVYGPSAAANAGRLNVGVKAAVAANVLAYASFDGAVSDRGNTYAGTGGVKIVW